MDLRYTCKKFKLATTLCGLVKNCSMQFCENEKNGKVRKTYAVTYHLFGFWIFWTLSCLMKTVNCVHFLNRSFSLTMMMMILILDQICCSILMMKSYLVIVNFCAYAHPYSQHQSNYCYC